MFTFRLFLMVARRSLRVVALVALIGAAAALLIEVSAARFYTAAAVVALESRTPLSDDAHVRYNRRSQSLSTAELSDVLSDPEQAGDHSWWADFEPQLREYFESGFAMFGKPRAWPEEAVLQRSLQLFRFIPEEQNGRLTIEVRSEVPVLSAQLANAAARAAVETADLLRSKRAEEARSFLDEKVSETNAKVKQAEQRLTELSEAHSAYSEREAAQDHVTALNSALTKVLAQKVELQAASESESLRSAQLLNSPVAERLRERLVEAEFELNELTKVLGPKHPQVAGVKSEQRKIKKLLTSGARFTGDVIPTLLEAAQSQERSLRAAIRELRKAEQNLSPEASEYEAAQSELVSLKKAQHWWATQRAYAETNLGSSASAAEVASPARVPRQPDKPVDLLFAAGGLVCGAALALLALLARVIRARRFISVDHAEHYLKATALAAVPDIPPPFSLPAPQPLYAGLPDRQPAVLPDKIETAPATGEGGGSNVIHLLPEMIIDTPARPALRPRSVEDAFRRLRGELMLNLPDGSRVLTVTSALAGEGKTTVAGNLGYSLAKAGYQTLIIDASLQFEPGGPKLCGLADYLHGLCNARDAIHQSSTPQLFHATAGNAGPDSRDLLYSRRMREFLGIMKSLFDYVILDAPALLPHSEALLLAELADASIFVIDRELSDTQRSRQGLEKLRQVKSVLAGIILNRTSENEAHALHRAA